jgi:hypothetical protein
MDSDGQLVRERELSTLAIGDVHLFDPHYFEGNPTKKLTQDYFDASVEFTITNGLPVPLVKLGASAESAESGAFAFAHNGPALVTVPDSIEKGESAKLALRYSSSEPPEGACRWLLEGFEPYSSADPSYVLELGFSYDWSDDPGEWSLTPEIRAFLGDPQGDVSVVSESVGGTEIVLKRLKWERRIGAAGEEGEEGVTFLSCPADQDPPFYVVSLKPTTEGDSQVSWSYYVSRGQNSNVCRYGYYITKRSSRPIDCEIHTAGFKISAGRTKWANAIAMDGEKSVSSPERRVDQDPPLYLVFMKPTSDGDSELFWQQGVWRHEKINKCRYGYHLRNLSRGSIEYEEEFPKIGLERREWVNLIEEDSKEGITPLHKPIDLDPPLYVVAIKPTTEGDNSLIWQYHVWRDQNNNLCKYGYYVTNWSNKAINISEWVGVFED